MSSSIVTWRTLSRWGFNTACAHHARSNPSRLSCWCVGRGASPFNCADDWGVKQVPTIASIAISRSELFISSLSSQGIIGSQGISSGRGEYHRVAGNHRGCQSMLVCRHARIAKGRSPSTRTNSEFFLRRPKIHLGVSFDFDTVLLHKIVALALFYRAVVTDRQHSSCQIFLNDQLVFLKRPVRFVEGCRRISRNQPRHHES